MGAIPDELAAALREHGWAPDGGAQVWTQGDSYIAVDDSTYQVGVRARGIQPSVTRAVSYAAALAWVRRDLGSFARLANRGR